MNSVIKSLTPRSKKSMKNRLRAKQNRSKLQNLGLRFRLRKNQKVRKALQYQQNSGENSNVVETLDELQTKVVKFAEQNSIPIPDIKKMKTLKIDGHKEKVPIRFRSENLKVLHKMFLSENSELEISLSHFSKLFPTETVVIPSSEDWGTALCVKCLNPRFKMEALRAVGCTKMSAEEMYEKMKLITTKNNTTVWDLHLDQEIPQVIKYRKWVKEDSEGSSSKIDRKVAIDKPSNLFKAELVRELRVLKEHIETCKTQFREVKKEKVSLADSPHKVIMHLDWSQNLAIKQARGAHSAFYYNKQISLHPLVMWHQGGSSSICTFSDSMCHDAAATWAGISGLLNELIREGYVEIVFISDSPSKQYRNRFMVVLLEDFVQKNEHIDLSLKWIYLESGHGKGAADGVGATVKSKLMRIVGKEDNVDFSAGELKCSYEQEDQNVRVILYTAADVKLIKNSSLYRNAPEKHGIGATHEVLVTKEKTTMKKRSGEHIFKTFTHPLVNPLITAGKTPSSPIPSTPTTSVAAPLVPDNEVPGPSSPEFHILNLTNSFISPSPVYRSFLEDIQEETPRSSKLIHDVNQKYDDLSWVLVKVETLSGKRTLHYVVQLFSYDVETELYAAQPYTRVRDVNQDAFIFKKFAVSELELYDEESIVQILEKPIILPRNKIGFSSFDQSGLSIM